MFMPSSTFLIIWSIFTVAVGASFSANSIISVIFLFLCVDHGSHFSVVLNVCALVSLSYYNKLPQIVVCCWNNKHFISHVLGVGESKIKAPEDPGLMKACFLICSLLTVSPQGAEQREEASPVVSLLVRARIPSWGEAPSPPAITLGIQLQHTNFGELQTFNLPWSGNFCLGAWHYEFYMLKAEFCLFL